jgi:spore maturation protein B
VSGLSSLFAPIIIGVFAIFAIFRRQDVFDGMLCGARDGLRTAAGIAPALVTLIPAVYMLRASGVLEALTGLLSPLAAKLGIPPETVPLMLIRPFSGSGALAAGTELISTYGADSFIGRTVAVMLGSTETTFYVIAVYFGAAGIKKSRHAIPSALAADLTGFIMAAVTVRFLMGS